MSDCYIREFTHGMSGDGSYVAQNLPEPALATQKITIGSSTQSNAFNALTHAIEIIADGACHYEIGTDPTASATTGYLPANTFLRRNVPPGGTYKIAIST